MEITHYQQLATRTIPDDKTQAELLNNFALGLAGESGELIDHLKKHLFHGHPLDLDYLAKELGDLLWYVNGLASTLNLSMNTVAFTNIKKLTERYPQGFTEEASINRSEE